MLPPSGMREGFGVANPGSFDPGLISVTPPESGMPARTPYFAVHLTPSEAGTLPRKNTIFSRTEEIPTEPSRLQSQGFVVGHWGG